MYLTWYNIYKHKTNIISKIKDKNIPTTTFGVVSTSSAVSWKARPWALGSAALPLTPVSNPQCSRRWNLRWLGSELWTVGLHMTNLITVIADPHILSRGWLATIPCEVPSPCRICSTHYSIYKIPNDPSRTSYKCSHAGPRHGISGLRPLRRRL